MESWKTKTQSSMEGSFKRQNEEVEMESWKTTRDTMKTRHNEEATMQDEGLNLLI